ncbi:MAG: type IV pilus modification protein PilV [Caldimonas sp.]
MATNQKGFLLIEAMVAVLIFSLGVLGMVAMSGTAVSAQSDSRYRTMASSLADEIASKIALSVDRTNDTTLLTSVLTFQHQATEVVPGSCIFSGGASLDPQVIAWAAKAHTVGAGLPGLPGASATSQQIVVDNSATGFNRVQITVCWKAPSDTAMRRHTLVTYIN